MLVRCVIWDEIKQHFDARCVAVGNELVEIRERSEDRVDIHVIGNVITEIRHWRGKNWGKPNCTYAELGEIRQAPDDSVQISYSVPVAVLKGARIDLVNHRPLPPCSI